MKFINQIQHISLFSFLVTTALCAADEKAESPSPSPSANSGLGLAVPSAPPSIPLATPSPALSATGEMAAASGASGSAATTMTASYEMLLSDYKKALPKLFIPKAHEKAPEVIAQEIVSYLQKMAPIRGRGKLEGGERLAQRLQGMMQTGAPLNFLLVGYPCKSPNTHTKVISDRVDVGELMGLVTLDHLCQQIRSVYPPGAHVSIVSDGIAYLDVLGLAPKVYETYQKSIGALIAQYFPETLSLGGGVGSDVLLAKVETKEATLGAIPQVDEETLQDMEYFFQREITDEQLALLLGQKAEAMDNMLAIAKSKAISQIAHHVAVRSKLFGESVAELVPGYGDCIRLSVHPHQDMSTKCGIGLGYHMEGTPWHQSPLICAVTTLKTLGSKGQRVDVLPELRAAFPCLRSQGAALLHRQRVTFLPKEEILSLDKRILHLSKGMIKTKVALDIGEETLLLEGGLALPYYVLHLRIVP